jgi:hypothetical protein
MPLNDSFLRSILLVMSVVFALSCILISACPLILKLVLITAILFGVTLAAIYCPSIKFWRFTKMPNSSMCCLTDEAHKHYMVRLDSSSVFCGAYFIFIKGRFLSADLKFFQRTFSLVLCRWFYSNADWRRWQIYLRTL